MVVVVVKGRWQRGCNALDWRGGRGEEGGDESGRRGFTVVGLNWEEVRECE